MTDIETYRARTAEMLADYDARLQAVRDADHAAALAELAADAERHAEYRAYLCSMADHGCECIALDYDLWAQVVAADGLRTDLQRTADHARDAVRRQPYPDRHVYAVGYLTSAVRLDSQADARAVADGIQQGINARVPL
jgi:hypothetical protein